MSTSNAIQQKGGGTLPNQPAPVASKPIPPAEAQAISQAYTRGGITAAATVAANSQPAPSTTALGGRGNVQPSPSPTPNPPPPSPTPVPKQTPPAPKPTITPTTNSVSPMPPNPATKTATTQNDWVSNPNVAVTPIQILSTIAANKPKDPFTIPQDNPSVRSQLSGAGINLSNLPAGSVVTAATKTATGFNITYYTPAEILSMQNYNVQYPTLLANWKSNFSNAQATLYPSNAKVSSVMYNPITQQYTVTQTRTPQTPSSNPNSNLNLSDFTPTKIVTNPIGYATDLISLLGFESNQATKQPITPGINLGVNPIVRVLNILYGMESWGGNSINTMKNTVGSVIGAKPTTNPFPIYNSEQALGATIAPWVVAGALAPVTGGASLIWGGINVGMSEGLNFAPKIPIVNPNPTGKLNTNPETIGNQFLAGEVTYGVFKGAGAVNKIVAEQNIPVLSRGAQITEDLNAKISNVVQKIPNPAKDWAENVVTGQEVTRSQAELDLYSHEVYPQGTEIGGKPSDLADIAQERLTLEPSRTQTFVSQLFNVEPRPLPQGIVNMPDVLHGEYGNADLSSEPTRVAVTSNSKPTLNVLDIKTGEVITEPYFANPEVISDSGKAEFMENLKPFDFSQKIVGQTTEGYDIIQGTPNVRESQLASLADDYAQGKISLKTYQALTEPYVPEKTGFDFSSMNEEDIAESKSVARATSPTSRVVTKPYVNEPLSFNNVAGKTEGLVTNEELNIGQKALGAGKPEPVTMPNFRNAQFESESFEFGNQPKSSLLTSSKPIGEYLRPSTSVFNRISNVIVSGSMKNFSTKDITSQKNSDITANINDNGEVSGTKFKSVQNEGPAKIINDVRTNEDVSYETANPFSSYASSSYYRQSFGNQAEEEELIYNTFPKNSPLNKPGTLGLGKTTQKLRQSQNNKELLGSIGLLTDLTIFGQKPSQNPALTLSTDITQTPIVVPFQNPISDVIPIQNPVQLPIVVPGASFKPESSPTSFLVGSTETFAIPFSPTGFQFNLPGQDPFRLPRRSGLSSRKRTYPILTGEDVLKL